jgi:hypothetical protein
LFMLENISHRGKVLFQQGIVPVEFDSDHTRIYLTFKTD